MSQYLFSVQSKNRLEQKGLLKRFTITCYGKQKTLEDARAEKNTKYKELINKKNTKEYEEYFLRYIPSENSTKKNSTKKNSTKKNNTKKNNTKKNNKVKRRRVRRKKNTKK